MDQRGAVTEQLADVIRIAQVARKTGVLLVEREGNYNELEEGRITFVEGRVTEAVAGHLMGQAALNWLNTWGTCRFVFAPLSSSPVPSLPPPAMNGRRISNPLPSPSSSGAFPRRIREANEVLPLFGEFGLTRAHRQLFLLIDGRRSVSDLVRLSARSAEEVYKLLADLERVSFIQR